MPKNRMNETNGFCIWLTGLPAAGKTTIAEALQNELEKRGRLVTMLDGDGAMRQRLSTELGFSKEDRDENVRRIGFVSQLLTRNGTVVLVSAISPYRKGRDEARRTIGDFMEVYVSTPLAVCEVRDPKDLYLKARVLARPRTLAAAYFIRIGSTCRRRRRGIGCGLRAGFRA